MFSTFPYKLKLLKYSMLLSLWEGVAVGVGRISFLDENFYR